MVTKYNDDVVEIQKDQKSIHSLLDTISLAHVSKFRPTGCLTSLMTTTSSPQAAFYGHWSPAVSQNLQRNPAQLTFADPHNASTKVVQTLLNKLDAVLVVQQCATKQQGKNYAYPKSEIVQLWEPPLRRLIHAVVPEVPLHIAVAPKTGRKIDELLQAKLGPGQVYLDNGGATWIRYNDANDTSLVYPSCHLGNWMDGRQDADVRRQLAEVSLPLLSDALSHHRLQPFEPSAVLALLADVPKQAAKRLFNGELRSSGAKKRKAGHQMSEAEAMEYRKNVKDSKTGGVTFFSCPHLSSPFYFSPLPLEILITFA